MSTASHGSVIGKDVEVMADIWVFVTDEKWGAALGVAHRAGGSADRAGGSAADRPGGSVTAAVVGPRALADSVAASGAQVVWVEPSPDTPPEAYAAGLAEHVAAAHPTLLVSTADPAARALLGAAAAKSGATVVPGVVEVVDGDPWTVRRAVLGGEAVETLVGSDPLAVILASDDTDEAAADGGPGVVRKADATASAMTVARTEPAEAAEAADGIGDARIVVSFGRGVRQKTDVALVGQLAAALGAEVACSMPVADDLGWLAKTRYVGRSGQHISPRLYLAVGISGAPQHMEGVRGAKVVVAINNDPAARIFRSADYGVVGDLYDVLPELIAELQR